MYLTSCFGTLYGPLDPVTLCRLYFVETLRNDAACRLPSVKPHYIVSAAALALFALRERKSREEAKTLFGSEGQSV